jgi:hypothetical protein
MHESESQEVDSQPANHEIQIPKSSLPHTQYLACIPYPEPKSVHALIPISKGRQYQHNLR